MSECKRPHVADGESDETVGNNKRIKDEQVTSANECPVGDARDVSVPKATDGQNAPLTEVQLGITEYVCQHDGFRGIIKQRYSDFIVTEVDLQSKLTTLDDISLPHEETNLPSIDTVLDKETLESLDALTRSSEAPPVVIQVETMSKEQRRVIHESLRTSYANTVSNTEDRAGTKVIVVSRASSTNGCYAKGKKFAFQKGARQNWPAFRGNYTHFTLYKENIDTMEAINLIAKFIGMKSGSFAYAGVKDKRAKTLQRVSVYRVEAVKLLNLNERLRRMMIGNVGYFNEPLKLGSLSGNRFHIVLRNVKGSPAAIEQSLDSLREHGYINYYGLQRFGTTSVPTSAVGLALLKGDWKLAVELILKPRPSDDEVMAQARKLWVDTNDATKALAVLRNRINSNEGHLLRGLEARGTKDLCNALNYIPRNMRLMYVHSYQSYLWNHVVSRRIAKYKLSTLEGDLIVGADCNDAMQFDKNNEGEDVEVQPAMTDTKGAIGPSMLQAGQTASIYDVVIPLFGYDVIYPNNEIRSWYQEILSNDGLNIDDVRHKIKTYSLSGSYRRLVIRPKDVKWSTVKYDDANVPLFDVLDVNKALSLKDSVDQPIVPRSEKSDGSFEAVKLEFTLPASSYATMALREVLRTDTSAAFQTTLNRA